MEDRGIPFEDVHHKRKQHATHFHEYKTQEQNCNNRKDISTEQNPRRKELKRQSDQVNREVDIQSRCDVGKIDKIDEYTVLDHPFSSKDLKEKITNEGDEQNIPFIDDQYTQTDSDLWVILKDTLDSGLAVQKIQLVAS